MPYFSIIIACHNAENYIKDTLNSVLNQTFRDFEIIIIDDASTDNSLSIIKSYSEKYSFIKYLSTGINMGAGGARNLGVQNCSGEWLSILDADDIFLSEKLQKQFNVLSLSNENIVLIGTASYNINNQGIRTDTSTYPINSKQLKNNLIKRKKLPPHSSIVYNKNAFISAGGFNQRFSPSEDIELWLRLIDYGEFYCVPQPLIEYRVHENSITNKLTKSGYSQFELATAARVCRYLRQNNYIDPSTSIDTILWEKFMNEIQNYIYKSKYIHYLNFKSNLKEIIRNPENIALHGYFLKIIKYALYNFGYILRLFSEYQNGNSLSFNCYKEIIKLNSLQLLKKSTFNNLKSNLT
jgi:glycosyltransferase involved in cell wall biosynthesis